MQQSPIFLSHVALRVLTIAITLVVGLKVTPALSVHGNGAPLVGSVDQKVNDDSCKVGQRSEPRVSSAHLLDRLLPVQQGRTGPAPVVDHALVDGAALSIDRPQGERFPIVKHVPRMERGDPPRT